MEKVTSSGGTTIAFDRLGNGPPVILVGGQLCDRALTRPTAEELAKHFAVFNYDRRGRGDRFFPVEFQRRVVRERLGITPDEMDSGHLVALARPKVLADRLEAYRKSIAGGEDGRHGS